MSFAKKARNAIVSWFSQGWAKDNLTSENINSGVKGFFAWLSDPLIRDALRRIIVFCVTGIINEIKQKDEENNSD